jgi:hypothetical protein
MMQQPGIYIVQTFSCHQNGSLTLLFLPITRHSYNIMHSQGKEVSISIASPTPFASRPRVSLIGNITIFRDTAEVPDIEELRQCYLGKHPDAQWWLPGDDDAAHIVSITSRNYRLQAHHSIHSRIGLVLILMSVHVSFCLCPVIFLQ